MVDQLPEEIHKMLQERVKVQATADLEDALPCFKVDRCGTYKRPPNTPVTRDKFTKTIAKYSELSKIYMQDSFSKAFASIEEWKNPEIPLFIFSYDTSNSGSDSVNSQP